MNTFLSPCILQTIIICCTIIVIVALGVSAYRIYRKQQLNLGSYIFNASIISLFAIAIFSYCFYGNKGVLDFISLASALISIILAIITIIYSFFSNSRSSGQIETLNKAAESVKDATTSYSQSAESLQENITKIINAVNRVEEKTDRLLGMTSFAEGIEGSNNNLVNFDLNAYIEQYIKLTSQIGIMAMYACIKSKDNSKAWNLSLLPDTYNQAYCTGFLISTTSAGFITVTIDFNNGNVTTINYLPDVKTQITQWISNFDFSRNSNVKKIKDDIDNYFDNT